MGIFDGGILFVDSQVGATLMTNVNYSDLENKVRRLYGVSTTLGVVPGRVTFVIGIEGIIKVIYSSQLHPAKHANEALRALKDKRIRSS